MRQRSRHSNLPHSRGRQRNVRRPPHRPAPRRSTHFCSIHPGRAAGAAGSARYGPGVGGNAARRCFLAFFLCIAFFLVVSGQRQRGGGRRPAGGAAAGAELFGRSFYPGSGGKRGMQLPPHRRHALWRASRFPPRVESIAPGVRRRRPQQAALFRR